MKKLFLAIGLFFFVGSVHATTNPPPDIGGWLADNVKASIIDHLAYNQEFYADGTSLPELLWSPIQVGRIDYSYIFALDGGVKNQTDPLKVREGIHLDYTAGAHINIAPFIRRVVSVPSDWTFLNQVEITPRISYDFSEHKHRPDYGIALSWILGTK